MTLRVETSRRAYRGEIRIQQKGDGARPYRASQGQKRMLAIKDHMHPVGDVFKQGRN
jgi:hypothetical protein